MVLEAYSTEFFGCLQEVGIKEARTGLFSEVGQDVVTLSKTEKRNSKDAAKFGFA